jgi:hypothetical protein
MALSRVVMLSILGTVAIVMIPYASYFGLPLQNEYLWITTVILCALYFLGTISFPLKYLAVPLISFLLVPLFLYFIGSIVSSLYPLKNTLASVFLMVFIFSYSLFLLFVAVVMGIISKFIVVQVRIHMELAGTEGSKESSKPSSSRRKIGLLVLAIVIGGLGLLKWNWNTIVTNQLLSDYRSTYLPEARWKFGFILDIDRRALDIKKDIIPYISDSSFDALSSEEQNKIMAELLTNDSDSYGLFSSRPFGIVSIRTPKAVYVFPPENSSTSVPQP